MRLTSWLEPSESGAQDSTRVQGLQLYFRTQDNANVLMTSIPVSDIDITYREDGIET